MKAFNLLGDSRKKQDSIHVHVYVLPHLITLTDHVYCLLYVLIHLHIHISLLTLLLFHRILVHWSLIFMFISIVIIELDVCSCTIICIKSLY